MHSYLHIYCLYITIVPNARDKCMARNPVIVMFFLIWNFIRWNLLIYSVKRQTTLNISDHNHYVDLFSDKNRTICNFHLDHSMYSIYIVMMSILYIHFTIVKLFIICGADLISFQLFCVAIFSIIYLLFLAISYLNNNITFLLLFNDIKLYTRHMWMCGLS